VRDCVRIGVADELERRGNYHAAEQDSRPLGETMRIVSNAHARFHC
jgi:hypothetical protein